MIAILLSLVAALLVTVTALGFLPLVVKYLVQAVGWYLTKKTAGRREGIIEITEKDEAALGGKKDSDEWGNVEAYAASSMKEVGKEWTGIIGFFHPFCNAGGGGERVLWEAIRVTQKRWPKAICVVYTGDHDVNKKQIISRVENRFNIQLHPPTITFLYLTTRHYVLASTWPHFTLLGQSIGSLILAYDAFSLLKPDIFIDTMGYAFALGFCKLLFPQVPTGSYTHYPTISTDMLGSLDASAPQGVNAGKGAGRRGAAKKIYWQMFAKLYSWVGGSVDVVMTNSSWTQAHIRSLWASSREKRGKTSPIAVVYPPCAVEELEKEIEVSPKSEKLREKVLVYIAQFRPEKNHQLILNSFAEFMATGSEATQGAKLVLIGSVRDDSDAKRVYQLRLLVNELKIKNSVEFHLDASWPEILDWLRRSSVGVNGMWNEHFGIGVVEYQAAGLISVVHDSGGPKADIVTKVNGKPTGFHATTTTEFAKGFELALGLGDDTLAMRERARISAKRFSETEFARGWLVQMGILVQMQKKV